MAMRRDEDLLLVGLVRLVSLAMLLVLGLAVKFSSLICSGMVSSASARLLGATILFFFDAVLLRASLRAAVAFCLTIPDEPAFDAAILLVTRRFFSAPFLVVTMLR